MQVTNVRANLEVHDVSEAADWFSRLLGTQTFVTMGDPVDFALIGIDFPLVALCGTETPAVPTVASCYVDVTGVDGFHDQAVTAGLEVTYPLTTHPYGQRDFVVRGPSGHQIAVGERVG